jgi:hypothetical protein
VVTQVHPAALMRASMVADELAEGLRRRAANVEASTEVGAQALPGFRLSRVLEALHAGWSDAMGRHRQYLDLLGNALVTTAQDYRQTDADVAAPFVALNRF